MTKPKILFYDIETFPNIAYTWGKYDQNVLKFKKHWEIASFSYKWQDEKEIHCLSQRRYDEHNLIERLYDLIAKSDVSIAHNGDSFDLKKAKAKFVQYDLPPLPLARTVDTKKVAKSQFGFVSNSLNDLGDFLGLGHKVSTGGFELWDGCMQGKAESWKLMEKYNNQDVALLVKVYDRLKAWAPNHPNIAAMMNRPGCEVCGKNVLIAHGFKVTRKWRYRRYLCNNCGHVQMGERA